MRIGVMLRHLKHQRGGIGTYTRNLIEHLLYIDAKNQYYFMYRHEDLRGSYSRHPNVEEIVLGGSTKLTWDQISVPSIIKSLELDLVFNPKFSVPLFSSCKKVFILPGADWFVFPQNYEAIDRVYHRIVAPLYFQAADAIISISKDATKEVVARTGVNPKKIKTIYLGVSKSFRPINDQQWLESVKRKHELPNHFILFVGQIYPMKNVGRIIEAFSLLRDKIPHKLVLVGKPELKYGRDLAQIDKFNLQDRVILTGWVPDEDLAAIYNLADLLIFPSLYEGFGIPLLEAMACGCPVLTSNKSATQEVVGDAGYLVNPLDVEEIASGVLEVISNPKLQQAMIGKGHLRVKSFSWEKCARETLKLLEATYDEGINDYKK